jgi:hypothetical protein
MSELREKIADDLAGRLADWLDEKTSTDSNRPAIVAAIQDYAYSSADAVLRVLAEHGDTQQVREQLVSSGALVLPRGDRIVAVMAVVARIVAARDAAVERAEQAERSRDKLLASGERHLNDLMTIADKNLARAERAEADLAAARMALRVARHRLDQVRALARTLRSPMQTPESKAVSRRLRAILDAPARPAGHDETGQ